VAFSFLHFFNKWIWFEQIGGTVLKKATKKYLFYFKQSTLRKRNKIVMFY